MKNLLFMVMSDVKNDDKEHKFLFEGKDEVYELDGCRNAQAPIVRLMMEKYPGEEIDCVALCTKESLKIAEFIDRVTNKFFRGNAVDYLREELLERYQTPVRFHVVENMDVEQPEKKIKETIDTIRGLAEADMRFWVATNGGPRDIMQVLIAIISLLGVYGIKPEMVLGTRFIRNEKIQYILDQRKTFGIFDFYSGMDNFVKYGDAEALAEYYKDTTNPEIRAAVSAMKTISAGTEECDADKYQKGLEQLGKTLPAAKTSDDTFAIFADYVEADYGDLMKDDFNNILIVRRCLEKHLYQQALTFLESFMPKQYLKTGIFNVNVIDSQLLADDKKRIGKTKKDDGDFCIDTMAAMRQCFTKNYHRQRYSQIQNNWEVNDNGTIRVVTKDEKRMDETIHGLKLMMQNRESLLSALQTKTDIPAISGLNCQFSNSYVYKDRSGQTVFEVTSSLTDKKRKALGYMLLMHKMLKNCRNVFNHAASERPDMADIIGVLHLYCDFAEFVMDVK